MLRISTFGILWKPAFQDALFLLEKVRKIDPARRDLIRREIESWQSLRQEVDNG